MTITRGAGCVVLADRHYGVAEGVRGLLQSMFEVVVTVADEPSLRESVVRLRPSLAVVEMSLGRGGLDWLKHLRSHSPDLKVIVMSVHDEPSVRQATFAAGADGFVVKGAIATDLLPAVESVLAGDKYPA